MRPVFIYHAVRSARGRGRGDGGLAKVSAFELLSQLMQALIESADLPAKNIEDLILGCVTQHAEQAGNIARAAILYAGLSDHIPGMTVNRFCSSSLDALCIGFDRVRSASQDLLLVGGVEAMSRTDMFADQPHWMLNTELSRAAKFFPMGLCADLIASLGNISRQDADDYALLSQQRGLAAAREDLDVNRSIIPINTPDGVFAREQLPRANTSAESLRGLPVAFANLGLDRLLLKEYPQLKELSHIHTAGNSPAKADGASLACIGAEGSYPNCDPIAELIAYKTLASDPYIGLDGGYQAVRALLKQENLSVDDIALFEYNESFAAPTLEFAKKLSIGLNKLNINGGAIALGHPMGATGGILLSSLLDALPEGKNQLGIISICGAAGSGTAVLVRRF